MGGAARVYASTWSERPFGLIIAGSGEGADWNATANSMRASLGQTKPVEIISGTFGTKEVQKAVDRLQAQKVKKIVVLWLDLYSQSSDIEQLKYLLGINKFPSRAYMDSWKLKGRKLTRVKSKVPIVIAGGLDDHPAVSAVLESRAAPMSRSPGEESVVVVGYGSSLDEENAVKQNILESLARSMESAGGYKIVRTALIRPPTKQKPRLHDDSIRTLRAVIKDLSIRSRVIVVPHLLTRDGRERRLKKDLDNLFFRWRGQAILPDEKIIAWLGEIAQKASALENMVEFKDDGQALGPEKRERFVK